MRSWKLISKLCALVSRKHHLSSLSFLESVSKDVINCDAFDLAQEPLFFGLEKVPFIESLTLLHTLWFHLFLKQLHLQNTIGVFALLGSGFIIPYVEISREVQQNFSCWDPTLYFFSFIQITKSWTSPQQYLVCFRKHWIMALTGVYCNLKPTFLVIWMENILITKSQGFAHQKTKVLLFNWNSLSSNDLFLIHVLHPSHENSRSSKE